MTPYHDSQPCSESSDDSVQATRSPSEPMYPTRTVRCPGCSSTFSIARRALNLRCPNCGGQVQLQDAVLTGVTAGNVSTLGRVTVTRRGSVRGRIECSALNVQGVVAGDILVQGAARIGRNASICGELIADSVQVANGARINAQWTIGPDENVNKQDRSSI